MWRRRRILLINVGRLVDVAPRSREALGSPQIMVSRRAPDSQRAMY
jgi:hypothetical protein